jgi:hypothetical protein
MNSIQICLSFILLVFRPFNVKAKLIMTLKPRQQKFEKPMFYITIDLEHISLNLNRAQVSLIENESFSFLFSI